MESIIGFMMTTAEQACHGGGNSSTLFHKYECQCCVELLALLVFLIVWRYQVLIGFPAHTAAVMDPLWFAYLSGYVFDQHFLETVWSVFEYPGSKLSIWCLFLRDFTQSHALQGVFNQSTKWNTYWYHTEANLYCIGFNFVRTQVTRFLITRETKKFNL